MASVYERITNALSSLGKRRERDNDDGGRDNGTIPGEKGRTPKRFRPWEQSHLHRRLETFKQLTWCGKPAAVGPVPCALRGWMNDGVDSLSCEHCNAKLRYPKDTYYDQRDAAAELFLPKLKDNHTSTCPWRRHACNASLLAYIPTDTNEDLYQMFQTLQGKLLKVDVLPELDAIAIQAVRKAAEPYGSYDNLVMGCIGGALTPACRRTAVRIKDVSDMPEGVEASAPSFSDPSFPRDGCITLGDGDAVIPTYILQPSKITPQQKARLLALLGWDVDVLQPNSASGSAVLPYTQSAGYGLEHLGVKSNKSPKAIWVAGSAAGAANADNERYPMASVVLKCPHCNCRTGLWNFAGLRPVPTGRLTPSHQAVGAMALLTPSTSVHGTPGEDPLSVTIAGGQYGLHGNARSSAAVRPFGATSATPFRFGSSASTEPVFGMAALDAEAQRAKSEGGTAVGAGFGSPLGGSSPCGTAAAGAAGARLTGQKRKAEELGTPAPMAAYMATPEAGGGTGGNGLLDGKRPRTLSEGCGGTPLSAPRGHTPTADTQLPALDPLGQHRSWCPWVYTGTATEPHMSGWQHMLRALSNQQQAAPGADASEAAPMETTQGGTAAAAGTPSVNARHFKDKALAAIHSL